MCPHSSELAKATASPLETSDIIIVDNKECRRGNQKRTARETIGYTRGRKTKQKHNTLLYFSYFFLYKLYCNKNTISIVSFNLSEKYYSPVNSTNDYSPAGEYHFNYMFFFV